MSTRSAYGLGMISDFAEEGWPSMDLTSKVLMDYLGPESQDALQVTELRARFRKIMGRVPLIGSMRTPCNIDRFLNRFVTYPKALRKVRQDFDVYHVADHSYSHLLHSLRSGITGVYCHDLDTFKCLLDPAAEARPLWFKAMVRNILSGFESAQVIFHSTLEMKQQILGNGLGQRARLVHAPLGVNPAYFHRDGLAPNEIIPGLTGDYLLHVGSCIPRKRIDFLLNVFHGVRALHPRIRLIQIGGKWSAENKFTIAELGLAESVSQVRGIPDSSLASLYRGAKALLVTSDSEGFGIPVIECLASQTPVIATDLPVLREVGGAYVSFVPSGELSSWVRKVDLVLNHAPQAREREAGKLHASQFSWGNHARAIGNAYLEELSEQRRR